MGHQSHDSEHKDLCMSAVVVLSCMTMVLGLTEFRKGEEHRKSIQKCRPSISFLVTVTQRQPTVNDVSFIPNSLVVLTLLSLVLD